MRASTSAKKNYKSPSLNRFGALGRLTQGSGGNGNDGGGSMTMKSDRQVKRNVVLVSNLPSGLGLYLFDYLPEFGSPGCNGRQLGVMADEVEQVIPKAVCVHQDGYKIVDYSLLDIRPAEVVAAFRN